MALDGDMDDQMKCKINEVMEVVRNRSHDEVAFILEYFAFDVDTTIDCFNEGGASDILKKRSHTNSMKSSSKNKKKKNKKKIQNSVPESNIASTKSETVSISNGESADTPIACLESPVTNGNSSTLPEANSSQVVVSESEKNNSPDAGDPTFCVAPSAPQTGRVNVPPRPSKQYLNSEDLSLDSVTRQSETATTATTSVINTPDNITASIPDRKSISPSDSSRPLNRNSRFRSSSGSHSRGSEESSSRTEMPPPQAPAPLAATVALPQHPGKKNLEKSLKDLSRQTAALHRVHNILEEELELSFKRIKTAITEAHKLLEERNQELEQEMERVKKESRQLLTQRKDLAVELRQRAERAPSMAESELTELRADIKHFVVERKYDEELGKTCRFMWDKDRITQEIKCFGEVHHVKNSYSQRRQSVSSVASSSNMTSSITDPPELTNLNQTERDRETPEPNLENVLDSRPQVTSFPNRSRFFFRRNYPVSDSGNRSSFNRGAYPPRGRGGGEVRGGRIGGIGRGGRRDDEYRGGHEVPYHQKPHSGLHRGHDGEDHSHVSSAGSGHESHVTGSGWPIREQRPMRRGVGRHNSRFQRRGYFFFPRQNYGNEDKAATPINDSHINGNDGAGSLMNGFVDH